MNKKDLEEYQKCIDSPYYFATKYLTIKSKISDDVIPFKTKLSEQDFNNIFHNKLKSKKETMGICVGCKKQFKKSDRNEVYCTECWTILITTA